MYLRKYPNNYIDAKWQILYNINTTTEGWTTVDITKSSSPLWEELVSSRLTEGGG